MPAGRRKILAVALALPLTAASLSVNGEGAVRSAGPQIAPVEFDFEMFETRPNLRAAAMTRYQWVTAARRLNKGLTLAEARYVWRHPTLRRSMPIAVRYSQRGVKWTNPAVADATQGAVGGCHVATTAWEFGYFVKMTFPFFVQDPLYRFTLHRTWNYDGWSVSPKQVWHDHFITDFADLRWNFSGAFDIQNVYLPVGGSSKATHRTSRIGRFESIVALGGAIDDVELFILARWHGGWETPRRSAKFCTDNG